MKDTELKETRDRDLFLCYQKALKEHDFPNQWDAIEYVRTHEAPRFYISSKACGLLLGKLFAGEDLSHLHPLSLKRLRDLESLYHECRNNVPGFPRSWICETITDMPAPEFYVTRRYAARIINREMEKHNAEKIGRLVK
jgi:hypothetical protein